VSERYNLRPHLLFITRWSAQAKDVGLQVEKATPPVAVSPRPQKLRA
jgi:hypothetical protein